MGYIRGLDRNQIILFPERLDDYISEENSVRILDAYVNSLELSDLGFTKATPCDTGRPPYSPYEMLKLYIYGYMNRIRSSRRLEAETKRNVEVMWLMEKLSPDHKTIARFRKENASALKNVFRDFVKLCIKLGLYGKELVAIDGSKFKAVNSKDNNYNDEKLKDRIARLDTKIDEYMQQIDEADKLENAAENLKSPDEIKAILSELISRKELYQSYAEEMKQNGETQKSLTDPDSRRMMANGKLDICYNVQTSVDSKNKMIVTFDVGNNAQDYNQLSPMASESAKILEAENLTATGDKGYDSASDVAACIMQGINPHVADTNYDICLPTEIQVPKEVSEKEIPAENITGHTDGRCVYLPNRNIAVCPMGKILYPSGYKKSHSAALFRNGRACSACQCKCTKEQYKQFEIRMAKSEFTKEYDDKNIQLKQIHIKADKEIVKQRKCIAEHPFGTIKRAMDAGYLLTKGFDNVIGEFSLSFLAYNIKRAINILGPKRIIEEIKS